MGELRTSPEFCQAAIEQLKVYVTECIDKYGDDYQYSTDPRLLKIWILYVTPLLFKCQYGCYSSEFFCF
jgi:checkpoint serine/threonine-protein kinase